MSQKNSFQALINGDIPVFIDFHATWCGPCKSMEPVIKKLANQKKDRLRIIKIDIDKNPTLATQLGIRGVPTFALYHQGKQLWMQSGMMTLQQLNQVISAQLKEHA